MEQKKRKKTRKKNRSGQLEDVQEANVASPSLENPDLALSDREGCAIPAAEAGEGIAPNELSSVHQYTNLSLADSALPSVSFQKIAQELRSAFDSEACNSPALCVLLEDIKSSHAASKANLDHSIEQLRGELASLHQVVNAQKCKEVDLDAGIQGLKEEVLHLKALQQAEIDRKENEGVEIQHLAEALAKLDEGNSKQLRMVEAMSDLLQQLLKFENQQALMRSSQLPHNNAVGTPFASDIPKEPSQEPTVAIDLSLSEVSGAVMLPQLINEVASSTLVDELGATNLEKVNGYHGLINGPTRQEGNANQQSEQYKSLEAQDDVYATTSAKLTVNDLGKCTRDIPATPMEVETTYKSTLYGRTEQVDGPGMDVDNTDFVSFLQGEEEKRNLHEFTPKTTLDSDMELKPLSDAPITGAPIRFFRFVARYVSGADLVQ